MSILDNIAVSILLLTAIAVLVLLFIASPWLLLGCAGGVLLVWSIHRVMSL